MFYRGGPKVGSGQEFDPDTIRRFTNAARFRRLAMTEAIGWSCFLFLLLGPGLLFATDREVSSSRVSNVASIDENKISLDGDWQVSLDQARKIWRRIQVPGTIEDQLDAGFDGVSVYRKTIPRFTVPANKRVLLCFDAVATEAEVKLNGNRLGKHLGGWTPFQFDVTKQLRAYRNEQLEIEVQCDEKVGHNTQGFLPIIAPHFGGIWKSVYFRIAAPVEIDVFHSRVWGTARKPSIHFDLKLSGIDFDKWRIARATIDSRQLYFLHPQENQPATQQLNFRVRDGHSLPLVEGRLKLEAKLATTGRSSPVKRPLALWSPANPAMQFVRVELEVENGKKRHVIRQTFRVACREFEIDGDRFLLNGEACQIRGILNWGYAPPRVAPSLDEAFMRREIQFAKDRGFNLMKFCLWIPPRRYLELCDEMGMLAWIEYPTWHPQLTPDHRDDLLREYDEFFYYVRNHPSVVLHSLTCETGPSADLNVLRELYDRCKLRIDGAVVEDDSSWIGWNRIHDFYDDHSYGNNHTWVDKLDELKAYIAARETKPLVLGEAIAADTWLDPVEYRSGEFQLPPHLRPWALEANQALLESLKSKSGSHDRLSSTSRTYAHLMRKFQIETFRREVPNGGYVVSVIRDFPKASMGLIDYLGRPKTKPQDWNWHGDVMLLLKTQNDRRSFRFDEPIEGHLVISNQSNSALRIRVTVDLKEIGTGRTLASSKGKKPIRVPEGKNVESKAFRFDGLSKISRPTPYLVEATIHSENGRQISSNQWTLWRFPSLPIVQISEGPRFLASRILVDDLIKSGLPVWPIEDAGELAGNEILFVQQMAPDVLAAINRGSKAILLANNQPRSVPTQSHWFLRGGPIISTGFLQEAKRTLQSRALNESGLAESFVHLQHFDLAGDVVPNIHAFDQLDPLLSLWDNHDMREVRRHGLLFRMPVGKGSLWVSSLNHFGETNAAGEFLLRLVSEMRSSVDSKNGADNFKRLMAEIQSRDLDLSKRDWRFCPDKNEVGLKSNWKARDFDDSKWKTIRIDRHWESQGYPALDHWAWYRLKLSIPDDWKSETAFLNFTGVDDHYRLFVNGEFIGSDGDLKERKTAFENRKSYDISRFVKSGAAIQIAIPVYDWQGAGGIFRPVTLSASPLSDDRPILKK